MNRERGRGHDGGRYTNSDKHDDMKKSFDK